MENKLIILGKAHDFCIKIYNHTKKFPNDESFGLISQLRRAAVSVALNIVEGQNRHTRKEFVRFLYNARGSLEEVRECLLLSKDLEYLDSGSYNDLEEKSSEISKMLNGLIRSLKVE